MELTQTPHIKEVFYERQLPDGTVAQKLASIETRLLVEEAEKRNISWKVIPFSDCIEFTHADKKRYLWDRSFDNTTYTGYRFCINKEVTKKLLTAAGISTSKGFFIPKEEGTNTKLQTDIFNSLKKPLVIKLSHGSHGEGVIVGIHDSQAYLAAITSLFALSHKEDEGVIVEEYFEGKEYRILVSREKVLGIMHRVPANVIGDGSATIEQLIAKKNELPIRNIDEYLYPHIKLDAEMEKILAEQGLTPLSVPQAQATIRLRNVSNIMAGGDAIEVMDRAHHSVFEIAQKVLSAIPGLPFVGIDFMTKDIQQAQTPESYTIVEVNGTPEYAWHDFPMQGASRNVISEVLTLAFT